SGASKLEKDSAAAHGFARETEPTKYQHQSAERRDRSHQTAPESETQRIDRAAEENTSEQEQERRVIPSARALGEETEGEQREGVEQLVAHGRVPLRERAALGERGLQ